MLENNKVSLLNPQNDGHAFSSSSYSDEDEFLDCKDESQGLLNLNPGIVVIPIITTSRPVPRRRVRKRTRSPCARVQSSRRLCSLCCCTSVTVVILLLLVLMEVIGRSHDHQRLQTLMNTIRHAHYNVLTTSRLTALSSVMMTPPTDAFVIHNATTTRPFMAANKSPSAKAMILVRSKTAETDHTFLRSHADGLKPTELMNVLERQLIGTLYMSLVRQNTTLLRDIFTGAHVLITGDQGHYFHLFRQLGHRGDNAARVYDRGSSHYSAVTQYGITSDGPSSARLTTLLVGKSATLDTWFQFEGASWDPLFHPLSSVFHVMNYLEYAVTKTQIGPLGTSEHTEDFPLVIPYRL